MEGRTRARAREMFVSAYVLARRFKRKRRTRAGGSLACLCTPCLQLLHIHTWTLTIVVGVPSGEPVCRFPMFTNTRVYWTTMLVYSPQIDLNEHGGWKGGRWAASCNLIWESWTLDDEARWRLIDSILDVSEIARETRGNSVNLQRHSFRDLQRGSK